MTTKVKVDFQKIWDEALQAGYESVTELDARKGVVPMVVGESTTTFGNDIDYDKPTYFVEGGVCGFAWVTFAGNTAFGKWAKAQGLANNGYPTGLSFWVRDFGQSMQRKEEFARSFASVLYAYGIPAYGNSRMD